MLTNLTNQYDESKQFEFDVIQRTFVDVFVNSSCWVLFFASFIYEILISAKYAAFFMSYYITVNASSSA